MAATRADIEGWFDSGVAQGATHMIVKCDTFDWSDYPVYVTPDEDVHERDEGNKDRTMEVYLLDPARKAEQMVMHRAFVYE